MKYLAFIITSLLFASCNNIITNEQEPIKCSTANDVILLGYHGKIKHIERRQYSLNDCDGFEITDSSDFMQTDIDFDTKGLVTNYTISTESGNCIYAYIHDSTHTIGINYYELPQSHDTKYTDSIIRNWQSDTTYAHQNYHLYKTPFIDTIVETKNTTYTLDNQCNIKRIEYRKRKDTAIDQTIQYLISKNSDTLTYFSNNKKGKYEVILRRDHQNNPLKSRFHSYNSCDAYTYKYTYYE